MGADGEQLRALAKPFPARLIRERPVGGNRSESYVPHSTVVEKLLAVVGPFDWAVRQLDEKHIIGTITCIIDGRTVSVDGIGEGEDPKAAESDALKRAAMRFGLGLHLWSGSAYALDRALTPPEPDDEPAGAETFDTQGAEHDG